MITINNDFRRGALEFPLEEQMRADILKFAKTLKGDELMMKKTFGVFDGFVRRLENEDEFIIDGNMELIGGGIITTEDGYLKALVKIISEEENRGEKQGFDASVMEDVNTLYFEEDEILIDNYYLN